MFGDFFKFSPTSNLLENCLTANFLGSTKAQQPFLLKTSPFNNAPNFIYHFNHATFFCINTCALILINQYSTGLFVSYYFVRRKIQLPETWVQLDIEYVVTNSLNCLTTQFQLQFFYLLQITVADNCDILYSIIACVNPT